jgi:transposase InsO family protein
LRPLYHKFAMLCGKKSETLGRACGKPSCRFSDTDIPQQNAVIERVNGSLRDEPLNEKLFDTLDEARRKQVHWRYGNNRVSSHPLPGKNTLGSASSA